MSEDPAVAARYLDSASSEPLHPAARQTLLAALDAGYADPRRLHHPARNARLLLDNARAVVAEALGCRDDEVSFTGSGTEAVHRGLLGLAAARRHVGRRVVHSGVEHSAVVHAAAWWGTPTEVGADRHGRVGAGELVEASAGGDVAGDRPPGGQPRGRDRPGRQRPRAARRRAALRRRVRRDGSPAAATGWAALAGSAHKWGGPAGVGVLVVRRGAAWESPFPADDRTDHRASGFENVPAALAAAAALQAVVADRDEVGARQHALVDRVRAAAAAIDDVDVVGDPERRLPTWSPSRVLYVNGERLVTALDRLGFGVASGSACTASTLEPSRVLATMGALTHGNVRVSLTRDTTAADVEAFCAALPGVVAELRA